MNILKISSAQNLDEVVNSKSGSNQSESNGSVVPILLLPFCNMPPQPFFANLT